MNENANLKLIIETFIDKWNNTEEMWRNEFVNEANLSHHNMRLRISFGQGRRLVIPNYPYISFLSDGQEVNCGVYPYISYLYDENKLFIGLGISRDNLPNVKQNIINQIENYESTFFEVNQLDLLINELNKYIKDFEKILGVNNMLENFRLWASTATQNNGNLYAEGTINSYCTYLGTTIPNYINQETILNMNVDEIQHLINRLNIGDLNNWNTQQHATPINSLRLYLRFLQNLNMPLATTNSNTKNIILYGVPGVGKTHNINRLINLIERNEDSEKEIFQKITQNSETNEVLYDENLESRVVFTTFHQSFAYEDFIEGFRPNESGQIILRDGIFKIICDNARKDKENNYYLVIDEINRGNISKIFGELITLIEESKRDKLEISLPYSQEKFSVPSNLFIIGTMNSTDKSIALIDIALRRRFTFLELKPKEALIKNPDARKFFIKLNEQLEDDYKICHSYFMGENVDLDFVKEYKIKPLLKEYFYGNSQKLQDIKEKLEW